MVSNIHMTEEDKDQSISDGKMEFEDKLEDYKADYNGNMGGKFIFHFSLYLQ